MPSGPTSAGERQVDRGADPRAIPDVADAPSPWEQGVLVCGDVEHTRFALEDRGGAVAMVRIDIENEDALALVDQRLGGDGDVVEEAEPHGLVDRGMVAGRSYGEEGGVGLALSKPLDRVEPSARGELGGLERRVVHRGVGVDRTATHEAVTLQCLDVRWGVDRFDGGSGCRCRRDDRDGVLEVAERMADDLESLGTLWVPRSSVVLQEPFVRGVEDPAHSVILRHGGFSTRVGGQLP